MTELLILDRAEMLANRPALAIESNPGGEGWCVRARKLTPGFAASLGGRVDSLLRVKVAEAGDRNDEGLPDISGDHEILSDGVRFIPHFPFESGVSFRAIFDLRTSSQGRRAARMEQPTLDGVS